MKQKYICQLLLSLVVIPINLPKIEIAKTVPISGDISQTSNYTTSTPNVALESKQVAIPPILERIASCESGNKQFNPDGTVLRGKINSHDIGKFQINEIYHAEKAKELGFDIFTESGNTKMALWLYKNQGTKPWLCSKSCWTI